jgi:ATP-dependent helicase/nuclease subunit B
MAESRIIGGGAQVWVDAFSAMTALEIRLLAALGRHAQSVTVTLLADPDSPGLREMRGGDGDGLFSRTERLYRRLLDEFQRHEVRVEGTVPLRERRRFVAAGPRAVEAEMFEDEGFRAPAEPAANAAGSAAPMLLQGRKRRKPPPAGPTLFDAMEAPVETQSPPDPELRTGVELWECAEPETEVRMVAQTIRAMAIGAEIDGSLFPRLRYRQIAVILPDLGSDGDEYEDAVRRIFAEHGIPHFVDQRRSMAHHPLVELVRAAVAIVSSGFDRDEMLLFLKTQLAGISPGDAALLENYLYEHGITRVPWNAEWRWIAPNQREEEGESAESARARLAAVNAIRRQVWELLQTFAAALAHSHAERREGPEFAKALQDLLRTLGMEGQIRAWANAAREKGDGELAQVHEQSWRGVCEILTLLEKILAGRARTLPEFERLLNSALEQLTLGLIPPTVDQVLVSSVTRSRVPEMEAVFVLGAVEGSFPKVVEENPILSDAQREAFNHQAADPISEGSDRQLLEMPFFDYVALTRARRRLVVSYPLADRAGRALSPSRYVPRLRDVIGPGLVTASFDAASRGMLERMSTPQDVMAGLGHWGRRLLATGQIPSAGLEEQALGTYTGISRRARLGESDNAGMEMARVYNWIVASDDAAIADHRQMLLRGFQPRAAPALSPAVASRLFPPGRPMRMSVSQLERFAACPHQYFFHYVVPLVPREELALDHMDLGLLQHNILEGLYGRIIAEEFDWPAGSAEALQKALREETDRAIGALHAELSQTTPGYARTRQRILRMLGVSVEADRRRATAGSLRPRHLELFFGKGNAPQYDAQGKLVSLPPLALATPSGRQLLLTGKIDRVDQSDDGELSVLLDYKNTGRSFDLARAQHGLSVQLPVYVLAAAQQVEAIGGQPVGALYVGLRQKRDAAEGPSDLEPGSDAFYQRAKPRGFVSAAGAFALDVSVHSEDGQTGSGGSGWYALGFKKEGEIKKTSDLLSGDDFVTLIQHTQHTIGAMADRLAAGEIAPAPYKDGQEIPCDACQFQGICPFDRARGKYHAVSRGSKEEVLTQMRRGSMTNSAPKQNP